MTNKEQHNDNLSFDDLKKQLGMDNGEQKKNVVNAASVRKTLEKLNSDEKKTKTTQENSADTNTETVLSDGQKIVTENGKKFVDITDMYVSEEEKAPVQEEQKKEPEQVIVKKRIRTFNEIFSDFFKSFLPTKKDSAKEKMRKIVMDVSIIAIVCCLVAFLSYFIEYRQQLNITSDLREQIVDFSDMNQNQYNEAWKELAAKYPQISFPEGMKPDYAYLYIANQDFIGWLTIKNTNLDVQVVQSTDNDYYLKRDFYKKSSRYGCPYIDYRNNTKELDDNTIIYGHHMNDGLMFSNLDKYKTLEGYKESPIIQFNTLYNEYQFKVFAAFISTENPAANEGFNYIITDFTSDEKFTSFITEVQTRSILKTNVSVNSDDKIITLITCSHEFDNARLVVMGRMVRANESAAVDVQSATLNTSPKYPQAWYDKKGVENPYA